MSPVKPFIAVVVPAVTVAATLSVIFVSPPAHAADPVPVGPGELSRTAAYRCAISAGGLSLGFDDFTLAATADYPETAAPGDVLPARAVAVRWTASERLRDIVTGLLATTESRAEAVEGAWSVTTAGRTTELAPSALQFPRGDVPQAANVPWTMQGVAMIPAITVPQDATGAVWLGLPDNFTIEQTLYSPTDPEYSMVATCAASQDRLLGGIALAGQTGPEPPVLDVPTQPAPPTPPTPPTQPSDPTPPTDPPTDPTPPTDPPTDPVPGPGGVVPVGPGTLERTASYRCSVNIDGLNLGARDFTLAATVDYPETAEPGDVLPAREAAVRWTGDELIRQSVAILFWARESAAVVEDAAWSVSTSGQTTELAPSALQFPRGDVPQAANVPWTMQGTAMIPAITVPQDATGAVWLGLPDNLTITHTLFLEGDRTAPMVATCAAGQDRLLGGIALAGQTVPEPPVLDVPTQPTPPTEPTSPTPPTEPTDPTPYPSVPPAEPGSTAPVGPGELSRTIAYRCEIFGDGQSLGTHDVPVAAAASFPETPVPGATLAARPIGMRLTLPEQTRQAAIDLFDAYEYDGSFRSRGWSLTSAGRTTVLEEPGAGFPLAYVPRLGGPWTMQGEGILPAITVPADATGALWLEMPVNFRIDGRWYRPDHSSVPTDIRCTGPSDRRVGGIALRGGSTQPTTEPTAEPTTEPTTAPTSGPVLLAPTVKVGAVSLWRSAVFTVGVSAKGTVPSGAVTVRLGDRAVAKGRVFLGVAILTAGNLPKGQHTFSITYSGDTKVAAKTVTKVLRIN